MYGRNNAVQRAVAQAASRYSAQEWEELPPRQKTHAIYLELRQLDAAAWEQLRRARADHVRQSGRCSHRKSSSTACLIS
jgi:hypothetical protein